MRLGKDISYQEIQFEKFNDTPKMEYLQPRTDCTCLYHGLTPTRSNGDGQITSVYLSNWNFHYLRLSPIRVSLILVIPSYYHEFFLSLLLSPVMGVNYTALFVYQSFTVTTSFVSLWVSLLLISKCNLLSEKY